MRSPRFELHQLNAFVVVADCCNVSAAAKRLHIAQPALSRKIRLLEYQLGVELFERSPNGLKLTNAGRRWLLHARYIVELCGHVSDQG